MKKLSPEVRKNRKYNIKNWNKKKIIIQSDEIHHLIYIYISSVNFIRKIMLMELSLVEKTGVIFIINILYKKTRTQISNELRSSILVCLIDPSTWDFLFFFFFP